jgi:dehydrogenase/reductase SDR family protein 12
LVTGANAGLGLVVATRLAAMRASVHLLCRSEERGRAAVESIRQQTGNEDVHLHVVDVSSAAAVKAFAAEWAERVRLPINSLM